MSLPDKVQLGKFMNAQQMPVPVGHKTSQWGIYTNGGATLGCIQWYGPWRQYAFHPVGKTVFSVGCLTDIQKHIAAINKDEGRA